MSEPGIFLGCGSPCSSVELWGEVSVAGAFTWLRLGCTMAPLQEMSQPGMQTQSTLSTLLQKEASIHTLLMAESRLLTTFLLVPPGLQPGKRVCLPFFGPQGFGVQYVAQTVHFPGRISTFVIFLFWVLS